MKISIFVNGEIRELAPNTSLSELVEKLQIEQGVEPDPSALATAVNEIFIARTQREQCILKNGDHVFTFTPITGG